MREAVTRNPLNKIVMVAALGYFVDIYDLILFSIVRVPSLLALGVEKENLLAEGTKLLNAQMLGMLLGGILWGVLGDKKGRVSVLFGSILLYSLTNIMNAFVSSVSTYVWLRFFAGIGLAGELGAGITLVNEVMTKEHRGYGSVIVVSFGVLGAILANLVAKFGWENAYIVGGAMGFFLLFLRVGVYESPMFHDVKKRQISSGNFFYLLKNQQRFIRYLCCILLGVPIWFMIGILITFSPEFSKALGVENIDAGTSVMYFYLGTSLGDFLSGYLSQRFKSRKKIVLLYLVMAGIIIPVYLSLRNASPFVFYLLCGVLGFVAGYWAIFVIIASEQFGTNIRSTVTTTVPNFVRGSLVFLTMSLAFLRDTFHWSLLLSSFFLGFVSLALALLALKGLDETYGKDLDYVEV